MALIKYLFEKEKKPRKGLLAVEWVIMGYLLLTTIIILFTYTKAINPESMLWGRFRIAIMTLALWGVYRMMPCRFTHFCRLGAQLALLSWWYPDTFEINRIFPNLDPAFASCEQQLFGCQPSLLFSQAVSSPLFSELMIMGYAAYYPLIAVVALFYFFRRYEDFDRMVFITLTGFFIYYVIFIALPVTGPQYYFLAAGVDNISQGVFPDVGDYFSTHMEAMPLPGDPDLFFHKLMTAAHTTGERPTAAFPSSHVGMTIILLILSWQARNKVLVGLSLVLLILMNFATIYIRAHYVIDVFGGWASAIVIYAVLHFFAKKFV